MSVALAESWTVERFLDWAAAQEERYEFDGVAPVGMGGGTLLHDQVAHNLYAALRSRLRGTGCRYAGPNAGVQTRRSLRYPDALITCTRQPGTARVVTDVRAVFEVLSPSTERTDRIVKVGEYAAVPSILRYVLIESRFAGVTVLQRANGADPWTAGSLAIEDTLVVPEAGIEIPVAELYEDVELPPEPEGPPAER